MAVLDFLVNGLLLAEQGRAAMEALNPELAASMDSNTAVIAAFVGGLLYKET